MREVWHFSGVPQVIEVLSKQILSRGAGHESQKLYLLGYYPQWGKVLKSGTWSGKTETLVFKTYYWNSEDNYARVDKFRSDIAKS